jgi:hypothetical protein
LAGKLICHLQIHKLKDAMANDPTSNATASSPPTWRAYVHLYMPLITAGLLLLSGPFIDALNPTDNVPRYRLAVAILSAIPTHVVASYFYPADRPDATPEQAVRFTRRSAIYRAAVLFTYRWLYGTPFNLGFFIGDMVLSYMVDLVIPVRPAGTKPRRSEFVVVALCTVVSSALMSVAPPALFFWVGVVDRTMWRAAYMALVDDVIGVLARPNVRTLKGRVVLLCVQAFTIASLLGLARAWARRSLHAQLEAAFARMNSAPGVS